MATSDRNKRGKATDLVIHLIGRKEGNWYIAACGNKRPGVVTDGSPEMGAPTCKKCLVKNQPVTKN